MERPISTEDLKAELRQFAAQGQTVSAFLLPLLLAGICQIASGSQSTALANARCVHRSAACSQRILAMARCAP